MDIRLYRCSPTGGPAPLSRLPDNSFPRPMTGSVNERKATFKATTAMVSRRRTSNAAQVRDPRGHIPHSPFPFLPLYTHLPRIRPSHTSLARRPILGAMAPQSQMCNLPHRHACPPSRSNNPEISCATVYMLHEELVRLPPLRSCSFLIPLP